MKKTILVSAIVLIGGNSFCQSRNGLAHPVPIRDSIAAVEKWRFLNEALENKSIVAVGESLHGVQEYNTCKLEIIQYLHEQLGFNVLAIESDMVMNYFGNRYRDQISDSLFLAKLFIPVWHTDSYLELVQYIKSHPDLKIIGFDIVDINTMETYANELQLKDVEANEADRKFMSYFAEVRKLYKGEEDFYDGFRDTIMAKNVAWIIEKLYPGEKIMISAANDHISKTQSSKTGYMGAILSKKYPDRYYATGLFHSLGNPVHIYRDVFYQNKLSLLPQNSLQYKLLASDQTSLFIDMNHLKRNKKNRWIDGDILNVLETGKYAYKVNLSTSFDSIIWIKNVTHPNYVIASKYHIFRKN